MNRRRLSAGLVVLGVMGCRPAWGADTEAEAHARLLFDRGSQLYKQHDYDGARVLFQQAQMLAPRWTTLRNIASCELELGQPLDALRHLQAAMLDPRSSRSTNIKQDFDKAYAATGHLAVTANDGASISVDGTAASDTAPLKQPIDVVAGPHTLVAHLGERTQRAEVDAKPGVLVSVDLHFPAAVAPPPLLVGAPGEFASTTAPPPPAPTPPSEPERPSASSRSWWADGRNVAGIAVAGAAVATLATGVAFDLDGKSKGSTADSSLSADPNLCANRSSSACTSYGSLLDAEHRDFVASRTLYAVGGVLAAAAAVVLLWPHQNADAKAATTAWVAPSVGKRFAGLELGASF
jgi:hypothetical protein